MRPNLLLVILALSASAASASDASSSETCPQTETVTPFTFFAQNETHVAFEVKYTSRRSGLSRNDYKVVHATAFQPPIAVPAESLDDDDEEDDEDDEESATPPPPTHCHLSLFATQNGVECPPAAAKTFLLQLNLWGDVVPASLLYKDAAAGRAQVTIEKAVPGTKWGGAVR